MDKIKDVRNKKQKKLRSVKERKLFLGKMCKIKVKETSTYESSCDSVESVIDFDYRIRECVESLEFY